MSADYIRAVPIDLPADELAAVTAAIRGVIDGDRYPHAPRLDPLRAALARLEAARIANDSLSRNGQSASRTGQAAEPPPHPKASPPAKADSGRGDNRARQSISQ
jgi:hypothetical protein